MFIWIGLLADSIHRAAKGHVISKKANEGLNTRRYDTRRTFSQRHARCTPMMHALGWVIVIQQIFSNILTPTPSMWVNNSSFAPTRLCKKMFGCGWQPRVLRGVGLIDASKILEAYGSIFYMGPWYIRKLVRIHQSRHTLPIRTFSHPRIPWANAHGLDPWQCPSDTLILCMDPQGPVKLQLCPSICAVSLVPHPLNLALNPPTNIRLKFDSVIILLDVLVIPCPAIYCVHLILHHRSAVPSYVVPYHCSIMYTSAP